MASFISSQVYLSEKIFEFALIREEAFVNGRLPLTYYPSITFQTLKTLFPEYLKTNSITTITEFKAKYPALVYDQASNPSLTFKNDVLRANENFLESIGAVYGIFFDWDYVRDNATASEFLLKAIREHVVLEPGYGIDESPGSFHESNAIINDEERPSDGDEVNSINTNEDVFDDADTVIVIGRGRHVRLQDLTVKGEIVTEYNLNIPEWRPVEYKTCSIKNNAFYSDAVNLISCAFMFGYVSPSNYMSFYTLLTLYGNGDAVEDRFGILRRVQTKRPAGGNVTPIERTTTREKVLSRVNGKFYWQVHTLFRNSLEYSSGSVLALVEYYLSELILKTNVLSTSPTLSNQRHIDRLLNIKFTMRNLDISYQDVLYAPQLIKYHQLYQNPRDNLWAYTVLVSHLMICLANSRIQKRRGLEKSTQISLFNDVDSESEGEEISHSECTFLPNVKQYYYQWTLYPIRTVAQGTSIRFNERAALFLTLLMNTWLE